MKVLFWVPYPSEGASNRYRVEQYLPYLKQNKIEYTLHSFWNRDAFRILYKRKFYFKKFIFFILGTLSRIVDVIRINQYDMVFIHREAYPIGGLLFERILSVLKKTFIFDFDDAIFLPASSRSNSFIERFKNQNKIAKIIKRSTCVIAGNQYLADYALKYNQNVFIIPTAIDTDKYFPLYNKKQSGEIVIGWIGSITTIDFLSILKNTFIQLSKRFRHITFKIIGGNFPSEGLHNLISKQWLLNEEIEDLKTFDIGIMPMSDNQWTRGKCGFKAILYMSMGISTICSRVGMNKEIITDGMNGFLADTQEEWIDKFSLLIENPQLRKNIGSAGRETVEEKYSLKINAPKFLEILNEVYSRK